MSLVGGHYAESRKQSHQEDPHRNGSSASQQAGPKDEAEGEDSKLNDPALLFWSKLWEHQAELDQTLLGKLQVMEKFFTPVELHQAAWGCAHEEGNRARAEHPHHQHHHPHHSHHRSHHHQHHHHHPHHSHHHQHHHHKSQWAEGQESHGNSTYATPGSSSLHGEDGHHHHHGHHHEHLPYPDNHHHYHHHSTDVTSHGYTNSHPQAHPHDHPHISVTASSLTSSSGSCSISSSSSTWSSEASINNETFLMDGKGGLSQTQHSQSCTDISKHRRDFEEEEDNEEDTMPLLGEGCCLYKSASLERSLTYGSNHEICLESGNPKRTMSSIQLPSKSILKKKQGQGSRVGKPGNFRKAKSMEALSSRDEETSPGFWGGGAGRLMLNKKDQEQKKEEARKNLVKEKLQFSAFLNEITRQVLSPSRLSSLGVTNAQRLASAGSTYPKSPKFSRQERQGAQQEEEKSRQQINRPGSPDSMVSSIHSYSSRHSHSSQHHHPHPISGTPQLQHHTSGSHTDAITSPENIPSLGAEGQGLMGGKIHQGGSKPLLIDSTNTSPELSPSLLRHSHSHSQSHSHGYHQHNYGSAHHSPPHPLQHPKQAHHPTAHRSTSPRVSVTPDRESCSSKSDSSQNTASPCPGEPPQSGHRFTEEQLKDVTFEVNRIQFLQKQNEELHYSLLQTATRMESMEAEFKANHQQLEADMQRTQAELGSLKDKFKRLQDNYSSTQQANHLLEEKLNSVSQSVDGEQVHLNQSILELTNQLATAQTIIQSLENINVPSLLQEALGKRYEAKEAANQLLLPVAPPPAQFMDNELYSKVLIPRDDQVLGLVLKKEESNWLETGEGPKESGGGQQNITAVLPWTQEQGRWVGPEQDRGGDGSKGDEEFRRHPPPRSLQIPHLQFTMYPETLPVPTTDVSLARFRSSPKGPARQDYGVAAVRQLSSPSRVLPDNHHAGLAALKCTEAMVDLHQPQRGAVGDSDEDDIICNWRKMNSKGNGDGDGGGDSYQPAPGVMSSLVCQLQPMEVETRGWVGGVAEEVLNGERTQL